MRWLILLPAAVVWLAAAPRPGAFSRGYDVERYRIELRFDEWGASSFLPSPGPFRPLRAHFTMYLALTHEARQTARAGGRAPSRGSAFRGLGAVSGLT